MVITLFGLYVVFLGFINLTLFHGHRCVGNKLQIVPFRFLSTVV